jgi:hypothetical protein
MPYKVVKHKNGYVVVNENTGKMYSKHALSRDMAERQLKAIYTHTKDTPIERVRAIHHYQTPDHKPHIERVPNLMKYDY